METPWTLEELRLKLQSHDWTFMMSDDGNWYRRGKAERDAILRAVENLGDEGRRAYNEAHRKNWDTPHHQPYRVPYPEVEA